VPGSSGKQLTEREWAGKLSGWKFLWWQQAGQLVGGCLSRDGVSDRLGSYELASGCKLWGGQEMRECHLGVGGLTRERY
jgi:hypothetical protein